MYVLSFQAGELTDELLAVTQAWFAAVAPQPFDLVWSVARQPFLDLRISALRLLAAVAALDWGQLLMAQRAGMSDGTSNSYVLWHIGQVCLMFFFWIFYGNLFDSMDN